MLLACCFRNPSNKKHKKNKNWKNKNVWNNEESYAPSKSLLSSPKIPSIHLVQTHSSVIDTNIENSRTNKIAPKNNLMQEKYLKLEKEKEELKTHRRSFPIDFISNQKINTSTPRKTNSKNQAKSTTSTNNSTNQSLKLHQLIPKDVSRMFASAEDLEGSLLSVASDHRSLQISNKSLASSSISSLTKVSVPSILPTNQDSSTFTQKGISTLDEELSSSNERQVTDKQNEIRIDEIKENENKVEEVIKKTRDELEKNIQALKMQNQIELKKVKESYAAKLLEEKGKHMKNVEKVNIDAKNKANETISKLNEQIIIEKVKTFAEQQENSTQLEDELVIKNGQLDKSVKEIEQRETAWQAGRADVLNEVQRLKAEATRMVNILAMEGAPCGEDKTRSVSQEVYSLQLVVEMRTGEVRNLRDQLARATQQLEQAEIVKEKIKKATARMEDLEEQLKIKKEIEKQLVDEKIQLEMSMENTSNNADRISQNMESLQWRIRNNFDLPADNFEPVAFEQPNLHHQSFLDDELSSNTDTENSKFSLNHNEVADKEAGDMNDDIVISLSSCGSTRVSHEMNEINLNIPETEQRVSEAELAVSDCQVNNWNDDVESLDEGLGDVSSDCEHQANDHLGDQNDNNNNNSDEFDGHMDMCNSSNKTEEERIASIF